MTEEEIKLREVGYLAQVTGLQNSEKIHTKMMSVSSEFHQSSVLQIHGLELYLGFNNCYFSATMRIFSHNIG